MAKFCASVILFIGFSTAVYATCSDPGACYMLSGEIVSCEAREAEGGKILVVGIEKNLPETRVCDYPPRREAADWQKEWALSNFKRAKSFVVYPTQGMSCEKLPREIMDVPVAENCCDTVPPSIECSLKLNVLRLRIDA